MAKSRSQQIAEKTIYATFKILKEAGGELRGQEVMERIADTVKFDEHELHVYEKTGNTRWKSILHFYTIDCIKAGFLRKNKGQWILTEEGEKAIKLGPETLESGNTALPRMDAKRKMDAPQPASEEEVEEAVQSDIGQAQKARLDQYEEEAANGLREFILAKNPYEFQDLVAALLEAMGYHIADVAPRGPDGGIDIVAYNDPLGTRAPRIIVQVKHKPSNPIAPDLIQKLAGTMKRSSDVGILVTSGSYSRNARNVARDSREHIELIDFERFVSLWQQYYNKLSDEKKNLLPLHPVFFLGSNE